jgi:serine/threonine protein phosphatase PrpC
MSLKLSAWCKSDTGRKRERNEDSCLVAEPLGVYAVADGMGGHRGGAHASKLALEVLHREVELRRGGPVGELPGDGEDFGGIGYLDTAEIPVVAPADVLEDGTVSARGVIYLAAQRASDAVFDASRRDPSLRGMGTTLTAMLVEGGAAYIVHAGDSRAYRLRADRIEQITEDHSWTREQVKAGMMTEDEAKSSEFRHIITRSIGFERHVRLDAHKLDVEAGDCFLLCSDGMSNYVEEKELEGMMRELQPAELCDRLVELANERGGEDNITVVVVRAEDDSADEVASEESRGAARDEEAAPDADAPDADAYGDTLEQPTRK